MRCVATRRAFAAVGIGCVIGIGLCGCSEKLINSISGAALPFSAERAKQALLEMLAQQRSHHEHFHLVDPIEMSHARIETYENGRWGIGGFSVDPAAKEYTVSFGQMCVFQYTGKFTMERGRWVAKPPHTSLVACRK